MKTYHVERERCAEGERRWNAIKPGPMTKEEFIDNGGYILLYYTHLLTCPHCGRAMVVREGGKG